MERSSTTIIFAVAAVAVVSLISLASLSSSSSSASPSSSLTSKKKKKYQKKDCKESYLTNIINEFDPNIPIEKALTPPSSWYKDTLLYELEANSILMKQWHPIGNVSQLKNVGDYISGEILGISYIVLYDKDKKLRAYYNVCRHKASKLVGTGIEASKGQHPSGNFKKGIVCPYHGFHYSLDGKLLNARKMNNTDLNYDDFGLIPINITTWSIFIFINFDPNSKLESKWCNELYKRLQESDIEKLNYHSTKVDIINCNWKVYVDNYLDGGYHVPILHKNLTDQLSMHSYTTEIFDNFSIQGVSGATDCDRIGDKAIYGYIYPNFMINRYGPCLDTNYVIPLGVDKCMVVFDFYFDSSVDENFIKESILSADKTQLEDVQVSEAVQKGLFTPYNVGRYAKGVEEGELHFHRLLHTDYLKAQLNDNTESEQNVMCSIESKSLSW